MATQEKLLKSLEFLKHIISLNQSGDATQKSKEKILHCKFIAEAIQNPTIKLSKNFNSLLSFSISVLLQLCDDPESDTRMTADECLNKIIRSMNNGSISKVQIELHKGIKQNGSARSLRAALSRFALLAHHIRPQKGDVYVTNIVPALIKIFERNEESVHETLVSSLPKIMAVLGPFTKDYDIKGLLKVCLNNVPNPSVAIRRMTATCILTICLHCRAPNIFICYVFNHLFDVLIPAQDTPSNCLILGVLGTIKLIIPYLFETDIQKKRCSASMRKNNAENISNDKFLHVYELCLYYTSNKDHNIVNAALETLNIILNNLTEEHKSILLNKHGIGKSRVFLSEPSLMKIRSPSQLSVATTLKSEENNLVDSDLTDFMATDIEKWIDESKLSVINVNYVKNTEEKPIIDTVNCNLKHVESDGSICNVEYGNINIGTINDQYADSIKSESIAEQMDKLIISENSSEKSFSQKVEDKSLALETEFIGMDVDIGTFLDNEVPLLYCSRFIINQFLLNGIEGIRIPDKNVRVSIKNLALTCISSIIHIYPNALVKYLDKNCANRAKENAKDLELVSQQKVIDILLYECHEDPQIRAAIRALIANFISTVLLQSYGDFDGWIKEFSDFNDDLLNVKHLSHLMWKGLQDESTCAHQCLTHLNVCLNALLESEQSTDVLPILNYLPLMAQDPYWLVKVKLLELITSFCYVTVEHVSRSREFQKKVIHNILIELLKDEDQRVRSAASSAIIKIIPLLYFEENLPKETKITYKAIDYRNKYAMHLIDNYKETHIKIQQQVANLPFPYNCGAMETDRMVEQSLSRIVSILYRKLLSQSNKYFLLGCIETLYNLSCAYPVTQYRSAWNCFKNFTTQSDRPIFARSNSTPMDVITKTLTSSSDLLHLIVNLLSTTTVGYDINCHLHMIKLVGNLFAGKWMANLKPSAELNHENAHHEAWDLFTDKQLGTISEEYITHVIKLLNIYAHIIEENNPTLLQTKSSLPNLPSASNLSPLKRRKSDLGEKKISPAKTPDKENDKKSELKMNATGYFANSPHYMKIYEILKVAYNNYKATLDSEASENYLNFLRAVLYSMCQILEIATLVEIGKVAEEILQYLKATFILEPTTTVLCVQQLLKSLFSTNITSDADTFVKHFQQHNSSSEEEKNSGFFYHIAHVPLNTLSDCIGKFNQVSKNEFDGDSIVMGYVHRKDYKKIPNKNMGTILGNYIRIFEPMVIKSLKQYTMTSDIKLQAQVLQLLSQLVQLKVNYCLLDSDQVFIDFVLKQFHFMEEGQISLANELIPKIFQFLVHLSYAKQHTKNIIVIPKIIQLCDGLMASEQSPKTHCIPALIPVVEDVFLLRNKSNVPDFKELETTREVLVSMMIKLMEYYEVIDLLVVVLNESKYCENTERWTRWSKQIFTTFLARLRHNKIELENPLCMEAARRLLFILHPSVYKPISHIFIAIFEEAIDLCTDHVDRFLGKINLLMLLTSQLSESKFLLKIEEVQAEIPPHCVFEHFTVIADPLNVTPTLGVFDGITPEVIWLKFMFRTIGAAARTCVMYEINEQNSNMVQQLHHFLTYCLYLFQSGTYNKITAIAISLVNGDMDGVVEGVAIEAINKSFLQLRSRCPLLTFQWCYILTLLNYNDRGFWANVIQITDNYGIDLQLIDNFIKPKINCINMEIVRIGSSIVFADYLSEHILSDGEQMSWLLVNNIKIIVDNHEEPPIFELLGSIHRNSSASGLLIQAIDSKCFGDASVATKMKIIHCLGNVHDQQTGNLMKFLLPKVINSKILAVSRQVANLASRKVEYLLTLTAEDVNMLLPKEDLCAIMDAILANKLVKKHETLIGLLNKLASQFYDLSPLEFDQRVSINPEFIKTLQIDKAWYLQYVKQRCLGSGLSAGFPEILSTLSYDDLLTIMNHKDFNKKIIHGSFVWCLNHLDKDAPIHNLLEASTAVIVKIVNNLRNVMPKTHNIYKPDGVPSQAALKYSNRLTEILQEESFYEYLNDLIPCVTQHLTCVQYFNKLTIAETNQEDFVRFAVICLEIITFTIEEPSDGNFNVHFVSACLQCADGIFKELAGNLAPDAQCTWLCSAINSLYKLVTFLLLDLEPLPSMPVGNLKETLSDPDAQPAGQAVHQLYILIGWMQKIDFNVIEIPNYLMQSIVNIVISLARLPLANSFILTPPTAWKSGLFVQLSGPFRTQVPPLPLEYLQEIDILEEFIFRILLLGWTSRTQFEETWVSLLSALSANPNANDDANDINAVIHSNSLAVQAITAILLQTLYYPQPGNRSVSSYIHVSRDADVTDRTPTVRKLERLHKRFAQKLLEYPDYLKGYHKYVDVFEKPNMEKIGSAYSYSQLSLEYLRVSANMIESSDENRAAKICKKRLDVLQNIGIDLRSCLQFQLDLFTQWLSASDPVPLRLLQEIIKSIVQTSDIFNDKSQWQWMLDTCLEQLKRHAPEDEIIHQYLVIAICKSAAVLNPDREILDNVKKLISQSLKNTFLSSRIAGLHGLLYIMQMCVLDNTIICGISDDLHNFLPIAIDYIECNITSNNVVLQQSQEHILLVWSLAFYIIENVEVSHVDEHFVTNIFEPLLKLMSDPQIHLAILLPLTKGIERMFIKRRIPAQFTDKFVKYAMTQFQNNSPAISLPAAQLLLTSVYIEYSHHIDNTEQLASIPCNPDHLAQSIEKISAIFDKIKKGYPFEVDLLSQALSDLLTDIFSPADILTKVISEFLSPQQRHPMQLCKIVFNIFNSSIQQSQLSLLQDWVVFSLRNFTQSFSIGMATWCLTCFFISASNNIYLRNMFPYIQRRMGRHEYEDRKLLCIAGSDFYNNLTNDQQKSTFRSTLVSVKDQADMPFNELLLCL